MVDRLVEAWEEEGEDGRTGIESADAFLDALRTINKSQPRFDLDFILELPPEGLKKLQRDLTTDIKKDAQKELEEKLKKDMAGWAHYCGGTSLEAIQPFRAIPKSPAHPVSNNVFKQMLRTRIGVPHPD